MDNLALWHAVEQTDTSHVKEITGKAYRGHSPKPYWIIQKATEMFGPAGIGWGFTIVDEKLLDGALLAPGFYERIHMARVRVWYIYQGQRGEVEHVGQTAFCGLRKDGKTYTDEDAPKKSVTDALVKALSMIGFAGDIFLGRWDDSRYVAELREEERQAKIAAAAAPDRISSATAYVAKARDHVRCLETPEDVDRWWKEGAPDRAAHGIAKGGHHYQALAQICGEQKQSLQTPRAA